MTRIFATPRKSLSIDVVNQTVVLRFEGARRGQKQSTSRTFRNRYTLRKFLAAQIANVAKQGFVSVNR